MMQKVILKSKGEIFLDTLLDVGAKIVVYRCHNSDAFCFLAKLKNNHPFKINIAAYGLFL